MVEEQPHLGISGGYRTTPSPAGKPLPRKPLRQTQKTAASRTKSLALYGRADKEYESYSLRSLTGRPAALLLWLGVAFEVS